MGLYYGQAYGLITRVGVWKNMDVVPVEYGIFPQNFHFTMWFFQFITSIKFKWDYML